MLRADQIEFEAFAARVFQMHDPRAIVDSITPGSVDGGRDAMCLRCHLGPTAAEMMGLGVDDRRVANERSTTQLTLTRSSSLTDNLSFIPFSSSVTLD
jgi:hypothetical protein